MPSEDAHDVISIISDKEDNSHRIVFPVDDSDNEASEKPMSRSRPGQKQDVTTTLKRRREDDDVHTVTLKKPKQNSTSRSTFSSSTLGAGRAKFPFSDGRSNDGAASSASETGSLSILDAPPTPVLRKNLSINGRIPPGKEKTKDEHSTQRANASSSPSGSSKAKFSERAATKKRFLNGSPVSPEARHVATAHQSFNAAPTNRTATVPGSETDTPSDLMKAKAKSSTDPSNILVQSASGSKENSSPATDVPPTTNGTQRLHNSSDRDSVYASKLRSSPRIVGASAQTYRKNTSEGPNVERASDRASALSSSKPKDPENSGFKTVTGLGDDGYKRVFAPGSLAMQLIGEMAAAEGRLPARCYKHPPDTSAEDSYDGFSTPEGTHGMDPESPNTSNLSSNSSCVVKPTSVNHQMHLPPETSKNLGTAGKGSSSEKPNERSSTEKSAQGSSSALGEKPQEQFSAQISVQTEVRATIEPNELSEPNDFLDNPEDDKEKSRNTEGNPVSRPASMPREVESTPKESVLMYAPSNVTLLSDKARIWDPAYALLSTAGRIERIISEYFEEFHSDNDYWVRTWLQRARDSLKTVSSTSEPSSKGSSTSVFSSMKPKQIMYSDSERMGGAVVDLKLECLRLNSKISKKSWMIHPHCIDDDFKDIPNYNHFVRIRSNILAPSEKVLHHWPYISEDPPEGIDSRFHDQYYVDKEDRQRKLRRLLQAENLAEYMEDILYDLDCSWSDVLHFFLDAIPDVGSDPDAIKVRSNRDKFCEEDFARHASRWETVQSKLPPVKSDNLSRAALLCHNFQRLANFPLWHLARRTDFVKQLLAEVGPGTPHEDLTCRVCLRYNCPYHGEIGDLEKTTNVQDSPNESALLSTPIRAEDQNPASEKNIVQTDIINPPRVNIRRAVCFPPAVTEHDKTSSKTFSAYYWQYEFPNYLPENRGPFYPCNHPGVPCKTAACSCFRDKVPCEKSCACPGSCHRKYHGCSCIPEKVKKGRKKLVCFQDERCLCFSLGRECDPDLCGSCGVSEMLDPIRRHEIKRRETVCSNANLGRGIRKHTVLGESAVHGLGLYACETIQEHEYVDEYVGEIITLSEGERRGAVYEYQKLSYLFSLNKAQDIDGTRFGNKSRFINHADKANLYARIQFVNMVFRIGLYANKRISKGEELFFTYGNKFPGEQFDTTKAVKSTPHVRNSRLVQDEFYGVEFQTLDGDGTRRARKVTTKDASHGRRGATGSRSRSRNTSTRPPIRRAKGKAQRGRGGAGKLSANVVVPTATKSASASDGQSRAGATNPRSAALPRVHSPPATSTRPSSPSHEVHDDEEEEDDDDDDDEEDDDEGEADFNPAERLKTYYVSGDREPDEDAEMDAGPGAPEDDEFRPDDSSDEADGEEDDEEEEEAVIDHSEEEEDDEAPTKRPFKRGRGRTLRTRR